MNEYESYFETIKENNGVLRISVPKNLALFAGISKGDMVKVMIKKVETEDKEEE